MSDFSDRPFVAGSLTGLRAFKVDRLGRLSGVSHKRIFKPGENVAVCSATTDDWFVFPSLTSRASAKRWAQGYQPYRPSFTVRWEDPLIEHTAGEGNDAAAEEEPPAPAHTTAGVDCSCGYYAYFDGTNKYADEGTVTALVEGYGVCTVGARGFRAEKARLVAIINPDVRRLRDTLLSDPRLHTVVHAALLVLCGVAMLASLITGHWITAAANAAAVSINAWAIRGSLRKLRARERRLTLIAQNYPNVPVYRTLKAALRDHPLTVPPTEPLPTPSSHQDFWDMGVPS